MPDESNMSEKPFNQGGPDGSNEERGIVAPSEFERVQARRRDPNTSDQERMNLDYQVAAYTKQAENLGAMNVARGYLKAVYSKESDFKKVAEKIASDSSKIEFDAQDPYVNPLSGYVNAKDIHGIVREALSTQAEAFMVLHYYQMLQHPHNQDLYTQVDLKQKLAAAEASLGRARFWESGINGPDDPDAGDYKIFQGLYDTQAKGGAWSETLGLSVIDMQGQGTNQNAQDFVEGDYEDIPDEEPLPWDEERETHRTDEYVRANEKFDTNHERLRWARVMLKNDLYTRFTPNIEPRFYGGYGGIGGLEGDEKDEYDSLLQVGRAAYVKRVTSTHPDEYSSDRNQDMLQLLKENAEQLYNKEGTRYMMENYAEAIVKGSITLKNGSTFSFWNCTDARTFDAFRSALREDLKSHNGWTGIEGEIKAVEADVAAFGLLYIGLLPESADSRYSYSGGMHGMHYVAQSQEFRTVLHPQEWWENKMAVGHEDYGMFGKWGTAQMREVKEKSKFKDKDDIFIFEATNNLDEYWTWSRTGASVQAFNNNRQVELNEILVNVPLTHFPTTLKSVWEETKAYDAESGKDLTLLEYLVQRREIPWQYVDSGFIGQYSAKVDKAYKLLNDYFKPERRIVPSKEGWVDWASKLIEIRDTRLKLNLSEPKEGEKKGEGRLKHPVTRSPLLSPVAYHNLKVYAYMAVYGIKDPTKKIPEVRVPLTERLSDELAFHKHTVAYLDRGENLRLQSEK